MNTEWKKPRLYPKLSPDYIDIWRASVSESRQEIERLHSLLSPEEKERAGRYQSWKRVNQFIISRGLLRTLIGQCLTLNPAGFEFAYTEHQKPFLPVSTFGIPVSFNITQSQNMILVAMSLERLLGIDIELIRHNLEFKKMAKRFFSGKESALLEAHDSSSLPASFFACWTRKEAFVKALGDGITFGLGDFSVSIDPHEKEVNLQINKNISESEQWSIMNIETGRDYAAAVAANGGNFRLRLWSMDL